MGFYRMTGLVLAGSMMTAGLFAAVPVQATPMITIVGQDLQGGPIPFSFMGGDFSFSAGPGFPQFLAVQTAGAAAVRTVFGGPSTDFINRGTVVYDANTLGGFGSVPVATPIPFSNSENFLGLRVTSGGHDYYGFAYTTDFRFNSYGFETTPDTGITAVAATGVSPVPEPAAWAMMVLGFGAVGAAMRRGPVLRVRFG